MSRLQVSRTRKVPRPRSQTPGGWHKGLASGHNSGAVSHSAGQRAGRQSSLCLRLSGLGPAARSPLPWPFVCALPHSPLNPLLPAAHLATWAGQRSQALVSSSHPGQRQAFLSKSGSGLRDFVGITGDRGVRTAVSPSAWPGAFVWLRDWVCVT